MRELVEGSLQTASDLLAELRRDSVALGAVDQVIEEIGRCFSTGNKLLACGNGGSMADAMHFCEEWTGKFRADRVPLPAMALSDPSHLSCVANDFGYEQVFERQVRAFGGQGDVLLLLSTSGNSGNLVAAARAGQSQGLRVIGFLGRGGGEVLEHCDIAFLAPGITSDRIQELHMLVLHVVIEAVEQKLGLA